MHLNHYGVDIVTSDGTVPLVAHYTTETSVALISPPLFPQGRFLPIIYSIVQCYAIQPKYPDDPRNLAYIFDPATSVGMTYQSVPVTVSGALAVPVSVKDFVSVRDVVIQPFFPHDCTGT